MTTRSSKVSEESMVVQDSMKLQVIHSTSVSQPCGSDSLRHISKAGIDNYV